VLNSRWQEALTTSKSLCFEAANGCSRVVSLAVDERGVARCKDCGKETYPAHARCLECGSETLEPIEITGKGKVLTYTDLYALPLDYKRRYLRLAIVELDSGLRATG
jgi:uncharacterized OB-fold protein